MSDRTWEAHLDTEMRGDNVRMSVKTDIFVSGAGNCDTERHHGSRLPLC